MTNKISDFYPRSPCGERLLDHGIALVPHQHFYPRSPCGERLLLPLILAGRSYFYPRSPCGERHITQRSASSLPSFLSTLSLRRATAASVKTYHWIHISIHALLAESDAAKNGSARSNRNFYPRSPCGERHYQDKVSIPPVQNFYPRSPCGERPTRMPIGCVYMYFYPRSPCGERQSVSDGL